MTDLETMRVAREEPVIPTAAPGDDLILPLIGWVLVLVGWGLVGVIIAYVDRANRPPYVRDSYRYLIRTFWIGCAFAVAATASALFSVVLGVGPARLMSYFFVAWLAIAAFALWHLARCIKAIVLLVRAEPIANPRTWLV